MQPTKFEMDDKKDIHKRKQNFKRFIQEHRMNKLDHLIPGFRPHDDKTESYLIHINHIQDFKLPPNMDANGKEVEAELHFSFFYRDKTQQFFFGRSTRSAQIKLTKN